MTIFILLEIIKKRILFFRVHTISAKIKDVMFQVQLKLVPLILVTDVNYNLEGDFDGIVDDLKINQYRGDFQKLLILLVIFLH